MAAADRLAVLAAERGDVDELKHLVDAGNELAADRLAELAAALLSRIISETE